MLLLVMKMATFQVTILSDLYIYFLRINLYNIVGTLMLGWLYLLCGGPRFLCPPEGRTKSTGRIPELSRFLDGFGVHFRKRVKEWHVRMTEAAQHRIKWLLARPTCRSMNLSHVECSPEDADVLRAELRQCPHSVIAPHFSGSRDKPVWCDYFSQYCDKFPVH